MSNKSKNDSVAVLLITFLVLSLCILLGIIVGREMAVKVYGVDSWFPKIATWRVQVNDRIIAPPSYNCGLCAHDEHYGEYLTGGTCTFYKGDTLVVRGKTDTDVVFQVTQRLLKEGSRVCELGGHFALSYEKFRWLMNDKKKEIELANRDAQFKKIIDAK